MVIIGNVFSSEKIDTEKIFIPNRFPFFRVRKIIMLFDIYIKLIIIRLRRRIIHIFRETKFPE